MLGPYQTTRQFQSSAKPLSVDTSVFPSSNAQEHFHYAAARSSLSAPCATIIRSASGNRRCSALASSVRASTRRAPHRWSGSPALPWGGLLLRNFGATAFVPHEPGLPCRSVQREGRATLEPSASAPVAPRRS